MVFDEREEFMNIGVILFCAKQKFLKTKFILNDDRIKAFSPDINITELKQHLCSFEKISNGDKDGGPIARLDTASRFRWLTATRSTVVQTSKVHPGFCNNATDTLDKLFEQLVL